MIADSVPMNVATRPGAMMAVGFCEPAAARMPIIVEGISCTPEVVMAMNVTIGLVAVSLSPFSSWSSSIALIPSGVAALLRPSTFAAMATTIAPAAGWLGWNLGEHPAEDRPQRAAEHGDEPGGLGDPHDPQPQRHHADETNGNLDRRGG